MPFGSALYSRLPASTGTIYTVDGATGDTNNGGTSLVLRSSGADGVTNGTTTITAASASWSVADEGHGLAILIGATWIYRKILTRNSPTSITVSGTGAALTTGTARTWRVGGAWKEPQDFFDRASTTSTSPAPGDIEEIREWKSTLSGAIDSSQVTITLPVTPASLGLPASGTLFPIHIEPEAIYKVGVGGTTDGTTLTFTASDGHFDAGDIGRQIWIQNGTGAGAVWEKRLITAVADATHLSYSGATIPTTNNSINNASNRSWRIINNEMVTCTSYSGNVLTVTRATHSTLGSAHADGATIVFPYQGKRATSLTDTGARHVINSAGLSGAPYTVRNAAGHNVYLQANSNTAQGSQNEVLLLRVTAQYWRFARNSGGGSLTVEFARAGSGNPPNIYCSNCLDCEILGLRARFSQAGSGIFKDISTARTHCIANECYMNDIDLAFNHHGMYEEGDDSMDLLNYCHDHAHGNGIQVRSGAVRCIVAFHTHGRNRGTGSNFWQEDDSIDCKWVGNVGVDSNNSGMRGATAGGTGSGNQAWGNTMHGHTDSLGSSRGNFFNSNTNASMFNWSSNPATPTYVQLGPGDNQITDPLFVNRRYDPSPQSGSPLYNYAPVEYHPGFDLEYTTSFIGPGGLATGGAFASPEEGGITLEGAATFVGTGALLANGFNSTSGSTDVFAGPRDVFGQPHDTLDGPRDVFG